MKKYLASVILAAAISLISFGIHTDDTIIIIIGGTLAGAYSAMIYKRD